jgi:hypothetical protein
MHAYPTCSRPSSREIFAREIRSFVSALSKDLGLSESTVRQVLDDLRCERWTDVHNSDRQLSLPF